MFVFALLLSGLVHLFSLPHGSAEKVFSNKSRERFTALGERKNQNSFLMANERYFSRLAEDEAENTGPLNSRALAFAVLVSSPFLPLRCTQSTDLCCYCNVSYAVKKKKISLVYVN